MKPFPPITEITVNISTAGNSSTSNEVTILDV